MRDTILNVKESGVAKRVAYRADQCSEMCGVYGRFGKGYCAKQDCRLLLWPVKWNA